MDGVTQALRGVTLESLAANGDGGKRGVPNGGAY
eukprot:CAMPEP_0118860772 /NCGR_PEP_ID=MMETSP1163-20130328/6516_1 /TAXON_ID=124430 /ORGANISM="Phaeomonas parva, Strain CCMP2877" /LENGTH=33 /DNA_ID= /DNA_START= /DNA_END= /DNA_ORIENTATION=